LPGDSTLIFLDSDFWFCFGGTGGLNLGPQHLLGRCSTAWATPPALFVMGFFEKESHELICSGLALNCDPPDLCLLSS
jgi:hypothetical protein